MNDESLTMLPDDHESSQKEPKMMLGGRSQQNDQKTGNSNTSSVVGHQGRNGAAATDRTEWIDNGTTTKTAGATNGFAGSNSKKHQPKQARSSSKPKNHYEVNQGGPLYSS